MATYCISDVHGCYDEFMNLLEIINFNSEQDNLYVLGDVIDRGKKPLECLNYIRNTNGAELLIGNHEQMMIDYYFNFDQLWRKNSSGKTRYQVNSYPQKAALLQWVKTRPYYIDITVNERNYLLVHAAINASLPLDNQSEDYMLWERDGFIENPAFETHTIIFGHTPTPYFNTDKLDCSVWFDKKHNDKICIDCGCVFGGALAAYRLDDGNVFYLNSNRGKDAHKYFYVEDNEIDKAPETLSLQQKQELEKSFDEYIKTLPVIKSADPNSSVFVYPGKEAEWEWEEDEDDNTNR